METWRDYRDNYAWQEREVSLLQRSPRGRDCPFISALPIFQLLAEETRRRHFGPTEVCSMGGALREAEHPVPGRAWIKAPVPVPAQQSAWCACTVFLFLKGHVPGEVSWWLYLVDNIREVRKECSGF